MNNSDYACGGGDKAPKLVQKHSTNKHFYL